MTIFKKRSEERIMDVQFNIHKFTSRIRPGKDEVIIISCFSEFGCEVVGAMYCIPRVIRDNPGAYVIVMGWYGRSYLYKHLADEFWEIHEDCQNLRDHSLAFHHNSKNLKKIEKAVAEHGRVYPAEAMG